MDLSENSNVLKAFQVDIKDVMGDIMLIDPLKMSLQSFQLCAAAHKNGSKQAVVYGFCNRCTSLLIYCYKYQSFMQTGRLCSERSWVLKVTTWHSVL